MSWSQTCLCYQPIWKKINYICTTEFEVFRCLGYEVYKIITLSSLLLVLSLINDLHIGYLLIFLAFCPLWPHALGKICLKTPVINILIMFYVQGQKSDYEAFLLSKGWNIALMAKAFSKQRATSYSGKWLVRFENNFL